MARHRHLKNAPIVEAIIDLRVKNPSSFRVTDFLSLKEDLKKEYPIVEDRRLVEVGGKIEGKQIEQTIIDKGITGYFFKTSDSKNVAQFRIDGFTFSRLSPYPEWETVLSEAKRLWGLYSIKCLPELITRIAVRYINRLDLPLPMGDFAEYLTAPPTVPVSLPQGVSQFLTRVVIHDADITANIVQTMISSPKADHVGIVLDIDVFNQKEDTGFEESSIWPEFEKLRDLKNRIFFGSITEKTARLYE